MKKKEHVEPPASKGAPPAGGEPAGAEPERPGGAAAAATAATGAETLRAELDRARAREDDLLRALAELQNVQRRRRQEMEQSLRFAHEPLVRELLPVLDDLERALAALEGGADDSVRAGVKLVLDRLASALERDGLEAIRPLDVAFDPELHDALAQRPAPGVAPHTVVEVVKTGYRYRGRVLRHAQVIVSADEAEGGAS